MKIFVHEIIYIVQMRMYALNAKVFSNNELFMRWRSDAKKNFRVFLPINFLKIILLHVHIRVIKSVLIRLCTLTLLKYNEASHLCAVPA